MTTNSFEIFKQLFLKNPKDIKDIFTNVSTFVEAKDRAIAEFLSVEYPELIWLIRVLHLEYDKQFSLDETSQQHVIESIARSITLTVDETGILDYGQNDHNNVVFNTLETHLLKSSQPQLPEQPEQEDIISVDGSSPDMDLVYQTDTTFEDLAPSLLPITHNNNISLINTSPSSSFPISKQLPTTKRDASFNNERHNKLQNATVAQHHQHVIPQNTNDVVDAARLIDHVITSNRSHKQ